MTQQQQQQQIQYIEVVIDGGREEEVSSIEQEKEKLTCSPFDNTCTRITCPRLTWRDLKLIAQDCYKDNCEFSSLEHHYFRILGLFKNIRADREENLDALSTIADIDKEELPPVSRLRIYLQERRNKFIPLSILFGGSVIVVIFVSLGINI